MSEVWSSLGDMYNSKTSRSMLRLSGKETNQNRGMSYLAGNVCRGYDYSDKGRWKSGASRRSYLRASGLCKSFS